MEVHLYPKRFQIKIVAQINLSKWKLYIPYILNPLRNLKSENW